MGAPLSSKANAPGMQVADRAHVADMLDSRALRLVIEREKPHWGVPEIEAIANAQLVKLEAEGYTVGAGRGGRDRSEALPRDFMQRGREGDAAMTRVVG